MREARSRHWPGGLLGMFVSVGVIESILAHHDLVSVRLLTHSWIEATRAARGAARDRPLLCFGDSQIKQGAHPRLLAQPIGRSGFNLAVPGGQPISDYVLLKIVLARGGHPEAIIVGHYPGLLAAGLEINDQEWPVLLGTSEALVLSWISRSVDVFVQYGLRRAVPSIGRRDRIRAAILAGLLGKPDQERSQVLAFRHNWTDHDGAQALPGNAALIDAALPFDAAASHWQWAPQRVQAVYLRWFLDLAAKRERPVFWIVPLVSPRLQASFAQRGIDASYTAFLRQLQSRYPNVVVVDARASGYGRDVFRDQVHLDARGAAAFSLALGEVIRDQLAASPRGGRWVSLPHYQPPPDDLVPEDVEQSRIALGLTEPVLVR